MYFLNIQFDMLCVSKTETIHWHPLKSVLTYLLI